MKNKIKALLLMFSLLSAYTTVQPKANPESLSTGQILGTLCMRAGSSMLGGTLDGCGYTLNASWEKIKENPVMFPLACIGCWHTAKFLWRRRPGIKTRISVYWRKTFG
ncbi:hypothetical protein HN446_02355 [bacterium]|nr:hypothetical protein [bacterium]